jgi:AH receptor-interacting protein
MLKEKPNDVEWNVLNDQKLPILFNYSLCKFHLKAFYECIEHTSTILEFQPKNVKALFRRGKAHMEVWNVANARADMEQCREIDPGLNAEVEAQLNHLDKVLAKKEKDEREKYKGKLFT